MHYSSSNLEDKFSPILSQIKQTPNGGTRWSHLSSTASTGYGYGSGSGITDTPYRPASAVTTASSNSFSSVDSSGSSGGSYTKMKPTNLLTEFRQNSQNSLNWGIDSPDSIRIYELKERMYNDQQALIEAQKKELIDLKEQLQHNNLHLVKVLSSETEINAKNFCNQQIELENTSLKLKLAELSMSKEREIENMKSHLSEMEAKYQRALSDIGMESEEKTGHIINLEDIESEVKLQLADREEENRILRKQVSNLHATFQQQSQRNSNTQAQSESKWFNHIEKQNASITSLQEQVHIDERKLAKATADIKHVLSENVFLKNTLEGLKLKLRDTECELKTAGERTDRELSNMRTRHKEKYGHSLKCLADENMNLKVKLKSIENERVRNESRVDKLENELERTKASKAVGDHPQLFDVLYDKIRECVNEFQTICSYVETLGINESESFLDISKDYSLTLGHSNPEDRIKQLSRIQTRMKECTEYLASKFVSEISQDCKIQ